MQGKTGWKCEKCGNAGVVRYDLNADVYTVVHLLEDAHLLEANGACRLELGKVRVWNIPPRAADAEGGRTHG